MSALKTLESKDKRIKTLENMLYRLYTDFQKGNFPPSKWYNFHIYRTYKKIHERKLKEKIKQKERALLQAKKKKLRELAKELKATVIYKKR